MLEIIQLSKSYELGKKAVDNLSLTVCDGEIFAFIGHNGAGKTTTIKSIVGVLDFEEGSILLDGIDVKKDPILFKSKLAYIPDNPELYDHLTAIQYLDFIASVYKIDASLKKRIHYQVC